MTQNYKVKSLKRTILNSLKISNIINPLKNSFIPLIPNNPKDNSGIRSTYFLRPQMPFHAHNSFITESAIAQLTPSNP